MQVPGKSTHRFLLIAAVVVVVAAGVVYGFGGEQPADDSPDKITWPYGTAPSQYPMYWAMQAGHVPVPDHIEPQEASFSSINVKARQGDLGTTFLTIAQIPGVAADNPEIRLTGYKIESPDTAVSVFTRPDTGIESVCDLAGRTLAMPVSITSGLVTLLAIDEADCVDLEDVTVLDRQASTARGLLESGDVDAVMLWTDPANLELVFHPRRSLDTGIPDMLQITGHEGADYDAAVDVAQLQNETVTYGFNNFDAMTDDYRQETGQNGSSLFAALDPIQVNRVSTAELSAIQEMLDFAHERGHVAQEVNLTELLHEEASLR